MTRRPSRPRAYAPDPAAPGRPCEKPGCPKPGEFRAPKSRAALNEYWWFCLDHVREYNATWDFYKGMSAAQIEAETRQDTGWQRPTWPLGGLGGKATTAPWDEELVRDPLNVLGKRRQAPPPLKAPEPLRQPLNTLGLNWPVSLEEVKTRYKALAKQHHPDRNGGDKAAEERLKNINIAYSALRSHLAAGRMPVSA